MSRFRNSLALVAVGALALSLSASPAFAVTTTGAGYGSGSATATTGTLTMPAGYPAATWVSANEAVNSLGGSASSGPAGNTAWGAVFGSARSKPYLSYQIPMGITVGTPQSFTFTFATPMPANSWGFNLGDVDAENVAVAATTTGGAALTGAQLGVQAAYNSGGGVDQPTSQVNANSVLVTGSGSDTTGASIWFQPTVAISTITFATSKNINGSPTFQIWFAALTNAIAGTATQPANSKPIQTIDLTPPGSTTPIETVVPQADGSFTFPTVAPTQYDVVPQYTDGTFGTPVAVDASNGNVSGVAVTASAALASTGINAQSWLVFAGLLMAFGVAFTIRRERQLSTR